MQGKQHKEVWQYIGYGIVLLFTIFEVWHAKRRPCLLEGDCEAYIAMVNHWQYNADILPHHAMRILPSILVSGLMWVGLTMDQGFMFLVSASFMGFGLGFYYLLKRLSTQSVLAAFLTLWALSAHWTMTYSLSNIYQATDALCYPIGLAMLWALLSCRPGWLLLLGVIGCAVRQNLFVFGFLSLLQCAYQKRSYRSVAYAILLLATYTVLTHYYQAGGLLLKHLIPPPSFFSVERIAYIWVDSDITWLLLPLLPMLLRYPFAFTQFFKDYPAVLGYSAIVVAQPFVAYEMTGQANFVRIAMQGMWPLYFVAALTLMNNIKTRQMQLVWGGYALLIATTYSEGFRGMLVLFMLAVLAFEYWRNVRNGMA